MDDFRKKLLKYKNEYKKGPLFCCKQQEKGKLAVGAREDDPVSP
jgi:hypothetical protein